MRTTLNGHACWVIGRVRAIHEHRLDIEYLKDGAYESAPIKQFSDCKMATDIAKRMNALTHG